MFFEGINYFVVIISTLVPVGLGFLWYSPLLFGKRYIKELNRTEAEMTRLNQENNTEGMIKKQIVVIACAFVTSCVIAGLLNSLIVTGIAGLLCIAILVWAAFSVPIALNNVIFGTDSFALFFINSSFQLLSIVLITLVTGIFG